VGWAVEWEHVKLPIIVGSVLELRGKLYTPSC